MRNENELWLESKTENSREIIGAMIREELRREKVVRADLSYLGNRVDRWWEARGQAAVTISTRSELRSLLLENLLAEHLELLQGVGSKRTRTAALLMERLFGFEDPVLARLMHEAVAEIAGIVDVKYPYEEHKELFPKKDEEIVADWGKGLGIIRPHSDDLYEDRAVNAMCLTVCKDTSRTPTWFWALKDLFVGLDDEELGSLALSQATYLSGKNVDEKIQVKKGILRRDPVEGIGMRIDFRIDPHFGPRMVPIEADAKAAFDKMRAQLPRLKPVSSNPSTGSISVLANYKVLHGRSALSPVMLYEGEMSRILFRSKGSKEGVL